MRRRSGGFVRDGGSSDDDDHGYRSAAPAGAVGQNRGAGGEGRGTGGGAMTTGGGSGTDAGGQGIGGGQSGKGTVAANPYLASAGGPGGNAGTGSVFGGGNGIAGGGTGSAFGGGSGTAGGMGGSGDAAGSGGPALVGNGLAGGTNAQDATTGGVYSGGNMSTGGPQLAGPGGPGTSTQSGNGNGTAGNSSGVAATSPNGPSNTAAAGGRTERPDGYVVGQPAHEQPTPPASSDSTASADLRGRVLRPGEWEPTPDPPPKKHDDKDGKDDDNPSSKHSKSLASKRGADWGLRDAGHGSVGVTRPIRIECYDDRLVVVSERGPDVQQSDRRRPAYGILDRSFDLGHLGTNGDLGHGRARHVLAARAPGLRGPGRRPTFCRIIDPAGRQRADGGKEIAILCLAPIPHRPSRSTAIPSWTSWPAW